MSGCDGTPCTNGGTCSLDGGGAVQCACVVGYSGADCSGTQFVIDQYIYLKQQKYEATELGNVDVIMWKCWCVVNIADRACVCRWFQSMKGAGSTYACCFLSSCWHFETWMHTISDSICDSAPCVNGGTCSVVTGAVSCACVTGYSGATCAGNCGQVSDCFKMSTKWFIPCN